MKYTQFVINNYRAISGPLTVVLGSRNPLPIIGVNESGKTTILHAIFAFDSTNDELNDGRHLKDVANLYKTKPKSATIQAQLSVRYAELVAVLNALAAETPAAASWVTTTKKRRGGLPEAITITRHLETREYTIDGGPLAHSSYGSMLAANLVRRAPYILFFDDFRDKIEEQFEIPIKEEDASEWVDILERLFRRTDKDLSIYSLSEMEERQRKSALAKVKRHLNETLTAEWANFRLDDREALEISIEYERSVGPASKGHLKLEVVESDLNGDKHFFYISDRSKGFYWFFNFVMKLEFNPKFIEEDNTIYLLDEPGSYLHASAQSRLCKKLRTLADKNRVIYCTHSHYLLDPEVIPLSSIRVAEKDGNGNIGIVPIFEHKGSILERRSAFQPVVDALHIKPFMFDLTGDRVIIVEGMMDYYALEMFRGARDISILPSVGANSVKFYVSLMLAWRVAFWSLWDNDDEGRKALAEASEVFGSEVASRHFRLIPGPDQGKRILQDVFDGRDMVLLKAELQLASDAGFDKVMTALFYSKARVEIIGKMTGSTRRNVEELLVGIGVG